MSELRPSTIKTTISIVILSLFVLYPLIAGCIGPDYVPHRNIWVVKIDSMGNPEWDLAIDSGQDDAAWNILQSFDGGYIIPALSAQSGDNQVRWITVSSNGTVLKDIPVFRCFLFNEPSAIQISNESYISWCVNDASYFELDGDGNMRWMKSHSNTVDKIVSVIPARYHNMAATGVKNLYAPGKAGDAWIAHLNSTGEIVWETTFGGSLPDTGEAMAQLSDGSFVVVVRTLTHQLESQEIQLIRYDGSGNLLWNRTWNGSEPSLNQRFLLKEEGNNVHLMNEGRDSVWSKDGDLLQEKVLPASIHSIWTADGGYAKVLRNEKSGYQHQSGKGPIFVLVLDGNGIPVWQKPVYTIKTDFGSVENIIQTNEGGFAIIGYEEYG